LVDGRVTAVTGGQTHEGLRIVALDEAILGQAAGRKKSGKAPAPLREEPSPKAQRSTS
jgi:hypothetical protein